MGCKHLLRFNLTKKGIMLVIILLPFWNRDLSSWFCAGKATDQESVYMNTSTVSILFKLQPIGTSVTQWRKEGLLISLIIYLESFIFFFPYLMFRKSVVKHLFGENVVQNYDEYVNTGKSAHLLKIKSALWRCQNTTTLLSHHWLHFRLSIYKYYIWRVTCRVLCTKLIVVNLELKRVTYRLWNPPENQEKFVLASHSLQ